MKKITNNINNTHQTLIKPVQEVSTKTKLNKMQRTLQSKAITIVKKRYPKNLSTFLTEQWFMEIDINHVHMTSLNKIQENRHERLKVIKQKQADLIDKLIQLEVKPKAPLIEYVQNQSIGQYEDKIQNNRQSVKKRNK